MWPHTVAILSGGQSKRMGAPKHLVTLSNGRTMLEVMIEFAHSLAKQTVIIGGEIEGQTCIQDLRNQHGPVGGIEALLNSNIDSNYLVIGCDMPTLCEKDILPLLTTDDCTAFSCENKILGLPLHINKNASKVCTSYLDAGGRSIKGLISKIPHKIICINENQSSILQSVNSREDLDKLAFE